MRSLRSLTLWASVIASLSVCSIASPQEQYDNGELIPGDGDHGNSPVAAEAKEGQATGYTIFNGIEVPPMKDIEGDTFNETIKDGYWSVAKRSEPCTLLYPR
jgi:hypothetical protein